MKYHYKVSSHRLKAMFIMLVCILSSYSIKAQTNLTPGDIVFAGYISTDDAGLTQDDAFSFILMKDIQANTEIYFTDFGWTNNNAFQEVDPCGPLTGSHEDGIIKWTASSDLTCGMQITIQCKTVLTANTGTVTGEQSTANNISYFIDLPTTNGDQLFAYQGSSVSPAFIAGISMNNNWEVTLDPCTTTSTVSVLPAALLNNNIAVYPDAVNAVYNYSTNTGIALATEILNAANWSTDLSTSLPVPTANILPLSITFNPCAIINAPTILSQPVSVNACESDTVSFSISAIDFTSLQWQYFDGSTWINLIDTGAASGSHDTMLVFTNVPFSYNTMMIRCELTGNALPNAVSNIAFLSLTKLPAIASFTPSRAICEGENCSFNVHAPGGFGSYKYQWQIDTGSGFVSLTNGGPYSGVFNKTITITNATAAMSYNYFRCIITGPCGPSTISTPVYMQVNTVPVITLQPTSKTICLGSSTTLASNASGSFVNFRWQIEIAGTFTNLSTNSTYAGTGGKILTITNPGTNLNGTRYRCVATGSCNPAAITDTVTLTIKSIPNAPAFTGGSTLVCGNTSGEAYTISSMQDVDAYNWTIAGNDVTSFISDTTSLLNFGANASSAIISVNASNQCGTSSNTTLNVAVNPVYYYDIPVHICSGDSAEINGAWYSSSTTIIENNFTTFGCDSNYITEVIVSPNYSSQIIVTICNGDSVFAGGAWQTIGGIYIDLLNSNFGCDSIINTTVIINMPDQLTQSIMICEGDSLFLESKWQYVSGTYVDQFTNSLGCDSIISTTLIVNPSYLISKSNSICNGDSLFLEGNWQYNSGTYVDQFTNSLGCDSIISTTLIVNPSYLISKSNSICNGDSLFLEGNWQYNSGTFVDHFTTVLGCDSTINTTLTVNPSYLFTQNSFICEGAALFFADSLITTSGTYYDTYQTSLGCDSTYVLNLVVYPNPVATLFMDTTICSTQNPVTLFGESPTGGIWSGAGVSGNQFDPDSIGVGIHEVFYTYIDNNGCSATVSDTIIVTSCSGLIQLNNTSWSVYPNPVNDQLHVKTNRTAGIYNLTIYGIDGRLIQKLTQNIVNEVVINTSGLNEGSYFITLQGADASFSIRFTK